MKFIIFITLFVCASSKMRQSCLTANSVCNADDISVVEKVGTDFKGYELCGVPGDLGAYPTDPGRIPERGSGKMRKPEECNGVCEYILSDGAREDLICQNAVVNGAFTLQECIQFKNAKQCVPDIGNLFMWIGIGVVLIGLCACCLTHKNRREKRLRGE